MVKNPPSKDEMQETKVRSLGKKDPLEKKWQPTPVLLPGKSHGQRSLAGYSPGGDRKRVRHDLATEQQQQVERISASRVAPLGTAFLAARSGPLTPTAPQHPGPEQALLGH